MTSSMIIFGVPARTSLSEFTEHWIEFWAGDNPDAPGSWVFGIFQTGVLDGR